MYTGRSDGSWFVLSSLSELKPNAQQHEKEVEKGPATTTTSRRITSVSERLNQGGSTGDKHPKHQRSMPHPPRPNCPQCHLPLIAGSLHLLKLACLHVSTTASPSSRCLITIATFTLPSLFALLLALHWGVGEEGRQEPGLACQPWFAQEEVAMDEEMDRRGDPSSRVAICNVLKKKEIENSRCSVFLHWAIWASVGQVLSIMQQ